MIKTFKKALFLAAAYYLIVILQGCTVCKCNRQQFSRYSLNGLECSTLVYNFTPQNPFELQQTEADTFRALHYGISLQFDIDKYAVNSPEPHWNLINSANACSCVEFQMAPTQYISRIRIITLDDFSDALPAGSEVTDLFVSLDQQYNPLDTSKITVDSLINDKDRYTIYEFAQTLSLQLYLDAAPQTSRMVRFRVTANGSNGNTFTADTRPAYIQ